VTMHLSDTVMEIWPFEVLPGRLFQKEKSVVGPSVLNITLISCLLFATLGTIDVKNVFLRFFYYCHVFYVFYFAQRFSFKKNVH